MGCKGTSWIREKPWAVHFPSDAFLSFLYVSLSLCALFYVRWTGFVIACGGHSAGVVVPPPTVYLSLRLIPLFLRLS